LPEFVVERYRDWLDSGRAGGLDYLGRYLEPRFDTSHEGIFKDASMVLCVAFPYGNGARQDGLWSWVARHARGVDYHLTVRQKLMRIAAELTRLVPGSRCRVMVDAAPVLERSLAVACGLGSIGRSGMLLVPGVGPRVVLGEIAFAGVPFESAADWSASPSFDFSVCGSCRACVESCPGQAMGEDGTIDVRRCLSYWTIEARHEELPAELAKKNRSLFGCDVCTEVCPQCRPVGSVLDPGPNGGLDVLDLAGLEAMSDKAIGDALRGTALERTGVHRLRRNARMLQRP
jgi:epoxyqueuosine reductase